MRVEGVRKEPMLALKMVEMKKNLGKKSAHELCQLLMLAPFFSAATSNNRKKKKMKKRSG